MGSVRESDGTVVMCIWAPIGILSSDVCNIFVWKYFD